MTLETADYEQFVRLADSSASFVMPTAVRGCPHRAGPRPRGAAEDLPAAGLRVDPSRNPVAYAHRTVHNLYVNRAVLKSTSETPRDSFLDSDWVTEPGRGAVQAQDRRGEGVGDPPAERARGARRALPQRDLSVAGHRSPPRGQRKPGSGRRATEHSCV